MSSRDARNSKKKQIDPKWRETTNTVKRGVSGGSSDDDNSSSSDEDRDMDIIEYRKFLSKIFPSKQLTKKVNAGQRLKKLATATKEEDSFWETDSTNDDEEEDEEDEEETAQHKSARRRKHVSRQPPAKKRKIVESEDDDEEEEEEEEEDDCDDDGERYTVSKSKKSKKNKNKTAAKNVNITFTINGDRHDVLTDEDGDEYDEDEDEDDSDFVESSEITEDEDASVSDSSDTGDSDSESACEETKLGAKAIKPNGTVAAAAASTKPNVSGIIAAAAAAMSNIAAEEAFIGRPGVLAKEEDPMSALKILSLKMPENKAFQKCMQVYEKEMQKEISKAEKKTRKIRERNLRIFSKIIKDKNTMNDVSFYKDLGTDHQNKIIKELKEINKISRIEKPYRMTLLESSIPVPFKSAAMKKINSLRNMDPCSGEFHKMKNWVDNFMRIPFGKEDSLPISFDNGVEACHTFMENAQKILNNAVYGLNDAKMQIMQMLGQLLMNPTSIGGAIAIHGPPGTGKTSLVKEGISKILNRPFAFIALGGATDSSFLEGHGYTYEGSTWGKIVQILIDSKCMNPVIYFDELDKISDTPRGEEIIGILTHLTDTSQNSQFHDKYFTEINFDISKCLFIFSYNDESKISPILKDRMYRIKTSGYSQKEKTVISNQYLLPKIRDQVRFADTDILIDDRTIQYIIENHCHKEDGVRNLKRCLEIVHTKLNLYRLMKPDSNLFEQDMSLKVEFPFTVTKDIVDKLIKRDTTNFSALCGMYV